MLQLEELAAVSLQVEQKSSQVSRQVAELQLRFRELLISPETQERE